MMAAERWIEVGRVEDIPQRGARTVVVEGAEEIAVFRTGDDAVFALINRCPHKGGPLSQGIVHGHSVACPLHNWTIALATGEVQGADSGCTPTVQVRIEDGRILIARPLTAQPLTARPATSMPQPVPA